MKIYKHLTLFERETVALLKQAGNEFGVSVEILTEEGEYTTIEASSRHLYDPGPFKPVTATLGEGKAYVKLSHSNTKDLHQFWGRVNELRADKLRKTLKPKSAYFLNLVWSSIPLKLKS